MNNSGYRWNYQFLPNLDHLPVGHARVGPLNRFLTDIKLNGDRRQGVPILNQVLDVIASRFFRDLGQGRNIGSRYRLPQDPGVNLLLGKDNSAPQGRRNHRPALVGIDNQGRPESYPQGHHRHHPGVNKNGGVLPPLLIHLDHRHVLDTFKTAEPPGQVGAEKIGRQCPNKSEKIHDPKIDKPADPFHCQQGLF